MISFEGLHSGCCVLVPAIEMKSMNRNAAMNEMALICPLLLGHTKSHAAEHSPWNCSGPQREIFNECAIIYFHTMQSLVGGRAVCITWQSIDWGLERGY